MILWIVLVLSGIIYFRQDTFVEKVKFKSQFFEFEIQAKEKNYPPKQDDSSIN
jgi:hypothetical protein